MKTRELGRSGLQVSEGDLRTIDDAASQIQIEGDRYAPQQMAMVGREAPPIGAEA